MNDDVMKKAGLEIDPATFLELCAHYVEFGTQSAILAEQIRRVIAALVSPPLPLQEGGQTDELPPLPAREATTHFCWEVPVMDAVMFKYASHWSTGPKDAKPLFTADQMRAYGLKCISAVSPQGGEAATLPLQGGWVSKDRLLAALERASVAETELRKLLDERDAAHAGLGEAKAVAPDWRLRSRVADLMHLLQFRNLGYVPKKDVIETDKAIADIKNMLEAAPIAPALPVAAEKGTDEWHNPFHPTPCTQKEYQDFKEWLLAQRQSPAGGGV